MVRRIGMLALVLLVLVVLPFAVAAQDPITLEPVTVDIFGVQSVVPAGWTSAGPGLFMRGESAGDVTLLALQAAPIRADGLLRSVLPQLRLTEAPEPVGELTTGAASWTLYQVDVDVPPVGIVRVDMAIAQADGQSYIVLFQSLPAEYDALHEQVFLPALEAYAPAGATPEGTEPAATPYTDEAVTFQGGAEDVMLSGTLSLPAGEGPYPALVLVSGSGPQDRDETIAGTQMKPFALLADALAREGIAVLRYDDRGVGGSTGAFETALTEDFTADAAAAIAFLESRPDVNPEQVGVLGHSEGGVVASQLGAQNVADFIISLAGTAVPGTDLLLKQNQRLLEAEGAAPFEIETQIALLEGIFPLVLAGDMDGAMDFVRETATAAWDGLDAATQAQFDTQAGFVAAMVETMRLQFEQAWLTNFLRINPADDWAQTTVPVLGLFGGLDVQVDAEQNAGPMEAALAEAGNQDVTIVVLPEANHLFQAATTGAVSEYATLPAEFTPDLIPVILDWLTARLDMAQ